MCNADIFLGFLAILFPPLPVWIKRGLCSADSLINILLCVLGYIPGLLHAWYIIARFPDSYDDYTQLPDHNESGRVTYVVVHQQPNSHQRPLVGQQQQSKQAGQHTPRQPQNYGATSSNTPGTNNNNVAGPSSAAQSGENTNPPPTYAEAVRGDHKIQTQD